LRLDAGGDAVAEFVDAGVGDAVEGAGAALATGDEALGMEGGEVLGDVLLGGAEGVGDLPHRRLLMGAQVVEDPQTRRVGQGAEAARDQLRRVRVEGNAFLAGPCHPCYCTFYNCEVVDL
jgi:hypothetical protein